MGAAQFSKVLRISVDGHKPTKKNLNFSDKLSTVFLQHTIHIILGPTHIWFLQCTMLNVDVVKWAVCLSCIS